MLWVVLGQLWNNVVDNFASAMIKTVELIHSSLLITFMTYPLVWSAGAHIFASKLANPGASEVVETGSVEARGKTSSEKIAQSM